MSALDELFASAKRNGIGVLVINNLQIGDVITADQVAGGDISNSTDNSTSNSLTVPREALPYLHAGRSAAAIGESGPCVPLDESLHGTLWQWRADDIDQARSKFAAEYAAQCNEHWQNR